MTISEIDEMFAAVAGQQIPGGCDDCHAYQRVVQDSPGIWICRVHHDSTCPFYRRRLQRELESLRKALRRIGSPARRAELAARAAQIQKELN